MFQRVVRIAAEGITDMADLLEVGYALGCSGINPALRAADEARWGLVLAALERFLASGLERFFSEAHISLWEEYAGGDHPVAEGEEPVGVHLSMAWGPGDEVIVQVPGLSLMPDDFDPEERRDLAKGLRALADELDRSADREERQGADNA